MSELPELTDEFIQRRLRECQTVLESDADMGLTVGQFAQIESHLLKEIRRTRAALRDLLAAAGPVSEQLDDDHWDVLLAELREARKSACIVPLSLIQEEQPNPNNHHPDD